MGGKLAFTKKGLLFLEEILSSLCSLSHALRLNIESNMEIKFFIVFPT